jgi:hypothetical protein
MIDRRGEPETARPSFRWMDVAIGLSLIVTGLTIYLATETIIELLGLFLALIGAGFMRPAFRFWWQRLIQRNKR